MESVMADLAGHLGELHNVDVYMSRETLVCHTGYELDQLDFHPA
jgi:hypothetical protein